MSETAAAAGGQKSGAQALYDRMRLQCNRFNRIRKRLDEVRAQVSAGKPSRLGEIQDVGAPEQRPLAFFEGLERLADANDRIIDALEASVEDLAALF